MENTLNIEGKTIAVGLDWRALRSETSEKKEAADLAKTAGTDRGIIFSAPSSSLSLLGLYFGPPKRGLICGAAWLAQAGGGKEDLVLIEPAAEGTSWLCAIRGGCPLQGYDAMVPNEALYDKLDELLRPQAGQDRKFRVYSPGAFVEGSEDGSFVSLTQDIDGKKEKPPLIGQVRGVSKQVLQVAGLCAFLLAAYVGSSWYLGNQRDAALTLAAATQATADTARQAEDTQRAAAATQARLEAELHAKVTAQPSYDSAVSAWLDAAGDLPVALAAWQLDIVTCKGTVCEAEYRREKLGTIDDFVAAAEEQAFVVGDARGNRASLRLTVGVTPRNLLHTSLPKKGPFIWKFTSQLQHLELAGLTFLLQDPVVSEVTSEPVAGQQLSQVRSSWAIGQYSLEGANFYQARDSAEYLAFDNIAVDTLKLDFSHDKWSIGGFYATN